MDQLQDLLSAYKQPDHSELALLKEYVEKRYGVTPSVSISGETIIISVPSASLANTLRLQTSALKEAGRTTKRLQFRIS